MALERAVISVIKNNVTEEEIHVMFNPEEYTVNRDNNFAQIAVPGLRAPIIQFVHGNMQTLEMELFIDTYEEHREASRVINRAGEDVRQQLSKITRLMDIDPTTHAPPTLLFTWASLSFTCVLARASQRFTMFLPDGTPVRARVQVTFNEFCNIDLEAKEIKRETSDYSKLHMVEEGETISSIAWRTFGNPKLWRPIALRNGLDDPRCLAPGTQLIIPQLPFRDPETGETYQ
ncbi:MAG: LysM peptidoglycan-binding domain-containing protein [Desulfobaccales bacterium]